MIALGQGGGIALSHGALLVLGAALAQAAFFVVQKPLLARYSAFEVTAYAMWAGTALILPLGAGVPGAVAAAGLEPLLAVALLGVGASAVGFLAWAFALARLPVSTASSALYAVPVVAIAVAFVWLGELPSVASVLGGALALAGVVLATRSAHAERDGARAARRGQRERVAAAGEGAAVRPASEREASACRRRRASDQRATGVLAQARVPVQRTAKRDRRVRAEAERDAGRPAAADRARDLQRAQDRRSGRRRSGR